MLPFQAARIRMALHVFVFLLMVCLLLSLALLWRLDWFDLRPSSPGGAKRSTLHRRLLPRCPDDCPACRLGFPASSSGKQASALVRPWPEVKSRRGPRCPQTHRHAGVRLSQRALRVLRHHRCSHPCPCRRWQAWPSRADPDVSLSSLPHHLHCPSPYPSLPFENSLPTGCHGADCPG
jgi:hypothetical protein